MKQTLGTWQLWGIAVGLVISGEYFGWSYGWASAGTLGFVVTAVFIAAMYTTFIFSFTELTTSIPHAGGPFAYARHAFGPTGGYLAGAATLVEFVFAPPAIALAIGAYLNVQFPGLDPKHAAMGAYLVFMALNIVGVQIAAAFELVRDAARDLRIAGLHGRRRRPASSGRISRRAAGRARTHFSMGAFPACSRRFPSRSGFSSRLKASRWPRKKPRIPSVRFRSPTSPVF